MILIYYAAAVVSVDVIIPIFYNIERAAVTLA